MSPRAFLLAGMAVMVAAALTLGEVRAQTLDARFERNPIRADETVRLIVEADAGTGGAQPDGEPLRRDFEILGQSSSTQITIENGRQSVRTRWIFELAPKHPGRLTAGPLRAGAMTSPAIVLEVLPAPAADEASSAREIFIETDVAPEDVYVQSQLTYTVRIYRAVEFLEATLSDFATEECRHPPARQGRDVYQGHRRPALPGHRAPLRGVPAGQRTARPAPAPARRAHRRGRRRFGDEPPVRRGTPGAPRVATRRSDGQTPPCRRRDAMAAGPRGDPRRGMARGSAPPRGGRTGDLDVATRRDGARRRTASAARSSRDRSPPGSIPTSRPS